MIFKKFTYGRLFVEENRPLLDLMSITSRTSHFECIFTGGELSIHFNNNFCFTSSSITLSIKKIYDNNSDRK
ncbi:hypothetical protein QLX08_006562 [Tetragonisca angustula]